MQQGTTVTSEQYRTLDYGVDAPEVTRMFFLIGIPLIATGAAVIALVGASWAKWLGGLLIVAALAPLTLGVMMRLYAWRGKLLTRDWMLARQDWQGTETVLDIGAGRGLLSIGAARRAPHGVVHAIDIWRAEDLTNNGEAALRTNIAAAGLDGREQIHTMTPAP